MKRLEDLTQKQLDGQLTTAEILELEQLLERDPAARAEFRALLQVEVALRNLNERFDVADAVMAQIKPAVARVPELPARPGNAMSESWFDRWFLRAGVPLAAAAGLVIAFVIFHQTRLPAVSTVSSEPQRSVVQGAQVVRGGQPPVSAATVELQPKDQLVAPAGTESRLTYEDRTRLRLAEGTRIVYQPDIAKVPSGSKRIELLAGTLVADVAKQPDGRPFVLQTSHAQAFVRGTKFALTQNPRQTRLEVEEGRVDFRRASDGATVSVEKDHFAVSSEKGKLLSRPQRVTEGVLAYYTFEEGSGTRIRDRSGTGEPLDLVLAGENAPPQWSSRGVSLTKPGYLVTERPATKVIDAVRKSGALTLEVWIEPSDTTQTGPARVLTLSHSSAKLNVMLAHGPDEKHQDAWVTRLRTSKDGGGNDLRSQDRLAVAKPTHLVFTREPDGNAVLYVNGKRVAGESQPGSLANWHGDVKLALGGDPGQDRHWRGWFRLAVVYGRALGAKEAMRNYLSGPDQTKL